MWDIIKTILTLAKEGLSLFKESKEAIKSEAKGKIGYDLFMIYTQLNELLIVGDQITDHLEAFATADFARGPQTFPTYTSGTKGGMNLRHLIDAQINNIKHAINSLERLGTELSVVSGAFLRDISEKLRTKRTRLQIMALEMRGDYESYVPDKIEFSKEQQEFVRSYLREREPRKQLDEIQKVLEEFRLVLEKNFSLSDVLIKVRDKNNTEIASLRIRH